MVKRLYRTRSVQLDIGVGAVVLIRILSLLQVLLEFISVRKGVFVSPNLMTLLLDSLLIAS